MLLLVVLLCTWALQVSSSQTLQSKTFVLIAAGQSNTYFGYFYERIEDSIDFSRVVQIPSNVGFSNHSVIPVREGDIRHFDIQKDKIGFITRAAAKYRDNFVGKRGRVVIIPAGAGGSGWNDFVYERENHWRADGKYFQDLVSRINYARDQLMGEFPAFLWHQGETDVYFPTKNYRYILQTFIASMREHIGDLDCPFVLGEMVAKWVKGHPDREAHQATINSIAKDVPYTAVVSSSGLAAHADVIHFTAAAQRELGTRYYNAIAKAQANGLPCNYAPASSGEHLVLNHKISSGGYYSHIFDAYHYGNTAADPRYSRLGQLWKYRNRDGWYKLKVQSVDTGKSIVWRQKINPMGVWRDSYVPIQLIHNSLGISEDKFQGLVAINKFAGYAAPALLTADTTESTWWFAVGLVYHFGSHPLNASPWITADHIKMFAIID